MPSSDTDQAFCSLNRNSPPGEKVACFRSLFRGRTDVYPHRFESRRTGRAGYSPACSNEWVRGLCDKPRIKCSNCPNQDWIQVTDRLIHWHLSGKDSSGQPFVMGVYPMLLDETCFFLALDLDGAGWQADAAALAEVVRRLELPLAIERSRSGKGAHLWFFFEQAVPAIQARRLGAHLLTEALDLRPEIGLGSYDRMFPNQDTLPRGGFGNLIALPLQKAARDLGNSIFLDQSFQPYGDPWAFLGNLARISSARLSEMTTVAERSNRIVPVRLPPSDEFALTPWKKPPSRRPADKIIDGSNLKRLKIVFSDKLYIPSTDLPPALRNRLLQLAAFQNPEFYKAQAMRLPTYDKPRIIACAEMHREHIALPRGCLDELKKILREDKVRFRIKDLRVSGTSLDLSFEGALRPQQQAAAQALLPYETGVLAAATAFGKTVLAAWMIAERGVNTLVLVHRQHLMEQWVARLSEFLNFPEKSIGRLGGGRRKLRGRIDVALIQSMVRRDFVDDRIAEYGHLIIDECHHLSAQSFERAVSRAKSKYILGLSATVERKDGHHPIIFMQCGPIRHRVEAKDQARARLFRHQVIVRPTGFRSLHGPDEDARIEYQNLCRSLTEDRPRNRMICDDVAAAVQAGRRPIVLTERTEHLAALNEELKARGVDCVVLHGGLPKQLRAAALIEIDAGNNVVLATGRYVGEGFDCPALDTLFLTMPVSWRGTIAQYMGRLHRLYANKQEVQVYDYADLDVSMLERMFDKRCACYEKIGYSILLPASALPGWPQEVPLPIDPAWKQTYAASVKRLILDGVDEPLANLFVRAAIPESPEDRSRSASEAFLFKRLESLVETKGRFKMNYELPIPFNQRGTMEVDFFCEPLRLVIELDGSQHLASEAAWRSDRLKDLLLQRQGYLVMRFLATDLAMELDTVLDSILATLADRERKAADSTVSG
ncbi:MAG: TOTE conflict system archaeo-eukaryotic primase domain-containing protein [Opitutales bacterium]